jgi:hypothetical protein
MIYFLYIKYQDYTLIADMMSPEYSLFMTTINY